MFITRRCCRRRSPGSGNCARGVSPRYGHPVEVQADEEKHLVNWLSKRLGTTLKAPKLGPLGTNLWAVAAVRTAGPVAHFMYQDGAAAPDAVRFQARGEPRDTASAQPGDRVSSSIGSTQFRVRPFREIEENNCSRSPKSSTSSSIRDRRRCPRADRRTDRLFGGAQPRHLVAGAPLREPLLEALEVEGRSRA